QLKHDAAGVCSSADGLERFAQSALRVRRVRHKIFSVSAFNFFGCDSKSSHRGSVGADEFGIETFVNVSNRRFVEQITETLVALLLLAMQMIKGPHALQFHP